MNSEYICSLEPELDSECEIVWAKLQIAGHKTVHISSYYRSHVDDEASLDQLNVSLEKIKNPENSIIIVGGDINLPGWDWKNNCLKQGTSYPNLHYKFSSILDDYNLVQLIEEPTRGDNILDLVCTNAPSRVNRTHTLPGIADHDGVYIEIDINPLKPKQKQRKVPLYKKADWAKLSSVVDNIYKQLREKCTSATTNELWLHFRDGLTDGITKLIPHKLARPNDSFPWISNDIRRLMRKRDKLFTKKKKTGSKNTDQKFRELKHKIQKEVRSAYWGYVEDLINPMGEEKPYEGMKRFWTFIKHRRTENNGIAPLRDNGTLITDPKDKATLLNRQFESVFTRESAVPEDLMPKSGQFRQAPDIDITEAGVKNLLLNLIPHKAAGPDQISPRVLREIAPLVAPALTLIFRHSLSSGEVPDDWRTANVAPIYKKGQKYTPANYRPVSLTCIASKLMEHIVTSNIMKHANDHNILYDLQHGFRKHRSCETQLLQFVSDINENLESKQQTDLLIMDFSKAFDKVGHQRLLRKLDFYGIKGTTNRWIASFLRDRKQSVVVEGEKSEYVEVLSGVPQGSVLGPSLFLFYINDICENLSSMVRLFADDTICYLAIKSKQDSQRLQEDLDRLGMWEKKWEMEFHPDKCEVIHITHNKKVIQHQYSLHGHILKSVDSAKYLGVTISSDFKWNCHIRQHRRKSKQSPGIPQKKHQSQIDRFKREGIQDAGPSNPRVCRNHMGSTHCP